MTASATPCSSSSIRSERCRKRSMRSISRATRTTPRSSRTAPAKPRTAPLPTSRSAPSRARSRRGRPAAVIESRSTTSCFVSRRSSAPPRGTRAVPRSSSLRHPCRQRDTMYRLVLLRHGESVWNNENRFTGWTDVDLSEKGREEAREAGRLMAAEKFEFDLAFTSVLKRAIRTEFIALDEMDQVWIPGQKSWRLNERHYGALQGLNKAETAAKHGEAQVKIWRRSYDIPPPPLTPDDPRHPSRDRRYGDIPANQLPLTESLKDTVNRFLPYWHETIAPRIKARKKVLITAHGNSLRALVKYLDNVPDDEIVELNIPTGAPLVYLLNEDLRPLQHYYLGDPEAIKRAEAA